ncbi:MAG: thioredoxin-disulfide reductase [Candidatus Diapherotrites archaeon]|nr:thioredoxin-disulfide reductase [Candidatus Diapherotrites archaeon]
MQEYDVVVIGAGPAGLSAAIYAARRALNTLILESGVAGGQMAATNEIENYPGVEKVGGMALGERMAKQADRFGAELKYETVNALQKKDDGSFVVRTESAEYHCYGVVIATGAAHRKLGAKGEDAFAGKGVSYCATCDALFFRGKEVAVVGGGNSALSAALYLIDVCSRVHIVHRRDEFRGEERLGGELAAKQNVAIHWDSVLEEVRGKDSVSSMVLKNVKTNELSEIAVSGVFIYVGVVPTAKLAQDAGVELDQYGFVKVGEDQQTCCAGVFAAGDVTGGVLQVAVAVGEGTIAGINVGTFVKNKKKELKAE